MSKEKVKLAQMAYSLLNKYDHLAQNHALRGAILDTRSQEFFVDNTSYELGEEDVGFGIDLLIREHGRTVFRAKGPWPTPTEFRVYVPGKWEEKLKGLYKKCIR